MSDDFDDDSFMADDSFLAEIDNIATQAVSRTQSIVPGSTSFSTAKSRFSRPTSTSTTAPPKPNGAVAAPASSSKFTLARPASRTVSAPLSTHNTWAAPGNPPFARPHPPPPSGEAGPSRTVPNPIIPPPPPQPPRSVPSASPLLMPPSSDDFPSISPRSMNRLDKATEARRIAIAAAHAHATASQTTQTVGSRAIGKSQQGTLNFSRDPNSSSSPAPAAGGVIGDGTASSSKQVVPSSRLGRTASGNSNLEFQTHLNFRKEHTTTKGKRWDRTAFAQTGRFTGRGGKGKKGETVTGKGKGKQPMRGWGGGNEDDDDEDMEGDMDEDDWGGPLAPDPKPLVDVRKEYPPQRHTPDPDTIGTYVYPTNKPKRDYQYEIVQSCFTDNCLVALPTGLGKTFVAGVVMLNFYRWFPTGKIVFLAPTKPLVHQQIEACQLTCGIPSKDAAVMTGAITSAKEREKLWKTKRVFYCTPQTLDNDLRNSRVDPRDIVLAVFDEAHKASGNFAYTTILAYLMAHHPYFRVLALTATPGADVPKVQGVVDALHISRIEIREAEDPGIRKYMNEKMIERHVVELSEVVSDFRDRWCQLMRPYIIKLVEKGVLNDRCLDARRLKPFTLLNRRQEIGRDRNSGQRWAMSSLQSLERMARALTHLLEFSIGMFHTTLVEIAGNVTATGKKAGPGGSSSSLRNNLEFQKILRDVEAELNLIRKGAAGRAKGDGHPKMTQTMDLLLAHFAQAEEEEHTLGIKNDTRAMVFCSFRECVLEVVDMLNEHGPVLRATKFVGQSQGKQEKDKGFNQREQKKTIQDFKDGKHNILVSTSIGEEGLDIGEVDFVVIYDMPKQPIKLLQRIGRTGRKRSGKVHVLMTQDREDGNWERAQATHRDIQEEILHSRNLELFEDVERLLPRGKLPAVEEKVMEVDPWDPTDGKSRLHGAKALGDTTSATSGPRKKASKAAAATGDDDEDDAGVSTSKKGRASRGAEIPDDAPVGFKSVATLMKEQAARKAKAIASALASAEMDEVEVVGRSKRKRSVSPVRSESDSDGQSEEEDDDDFLAALERHEAVSVPAKGKVKVAKARAPKGKGATTRVAKDDNDKPKDVGTEMSKAKKKAKTSMMRDPSSPPQKVKSKKATSPSERIASPVLSDAGSDEDHAIQNQDEGLLRSPSPMPVVPSKPKQAVPKRILEVDDEQPTSSLGRASGQASASPAPDIDFFLPSGPIRRGRRPLPRIVPVTPPDSEPESPSPSPQKSSFNNRQRARGVLLPGLPLSPNTDESLNKVEKQTITEPADEDGKLSPRTAAMVGLSQIAPADLRWDSEDEIGVEQEISVPTKEPASSAPTQSRRIGLARPRSSGERRKGISTPGGMTGMLPPPIPSRTLNSGGSIASSPLAGSPLVATTPTIEPTQFPIRRGRGPAGGRRIVVSSSDHDTPAQAHAVGGAAARDAELSSPIVQMRGARGRRVVQANVPSSPSEASPGLPTRIRPVGRGRGAGRGRATRAQAEALMELNADLSGSASSDESGSDLDRETHSDKIFAGEDFAPTQAPRGYDQRAMYRAGLSTQAGQHAGLGFRQDDRKAAFLAKARKPVYVTDDEDDGEEGGGGERSENEYELGSFVVRDEDELE